MNKNYDTLEQYDFFDDDYLERVADKYTNLIGIFLIDFSVLEQELNIAIADSFHEDWHQIGFIVIERFTMNNKIDLFYKMFAMREYFNDKKNKEELNIIKKQLEELNSFRNSIVHANWQSLSKDGYVRSKIIVDNEEGFVKFKKIQITPKIIRQKIKEVNKSTEQIFEYKEKVFQS